MHISYYKHSYTQTQRETRNKLNDVWKSFIMAFANNYTYFHKLIIQVY
jgi:hypothetical protein